MLISTRPTSGIVGVLGDKPGGRDPVYFLSICYQLCDAATFVVLGCHGLRSLYKGKRLFLIGGGEYTYFPGLLI